MVFICLHLLSHVYSQSSPHWRKCWSSSGGRSAGRPGVSQFLGMVFSKCGKPSLCVDPSPMRTRVAIRCTTAPRRTYGQQRNRMIPATSSPQGCPRTVSHPLPTTANHIDTFLSHSWCRLTFEIRSWRPCILWVSLFSPPLAHFCLSGTPLMCRAENGL